jgi:hypothetical protein
MTLERRLLIAIACLALGTGGQLALHAHLGGVNAPVYPELRQPLRTLPLHIARENSGDHVSDPVSLRAWLGADLTESTTLSAKIPFADDFLLRRYVAEDRRVAVRLYAVYSRRGEDREHHPEICIRDVAGAPEDKRARGIIFLDAAERRPVQRFRFRTGSEQHLYVYYWHYTLDAEFREGQSYLQGLHQRVGRRAPSLTLQVTTGASPADATAVEKSFLPAVDAALQHALLPPNARIGCERLPIRFTGND